MKFLNSSDKQMNVANNNEIVLPISLNSYNLVRHINCAICNASAVILKRETKKHMQQICFTTHQQICLIPKLSLFVGTIAAFVVFVNWTFIDLLHQHLNYSFKWVHCLYTEICVTILKWLCDNNKIFAKWFDEIAIVALVFGHLKENS